MIKSNGPQKLHHNPATTYPQNILPSFGHKSINIQQIKTHTQNPKPNKSSLNFGHQWSNIKTQQKSKHPVPKQILFFLPQSESQPSNNIPTKYSPLFRPLIYSSNKMERYNLNSLEKYRTSIYYKCLFCSKYEK
jgi:hypothetical protein